MSIAPASLGPGLLRGRQTFDYRWGQRARAEFSERDVLSFMAEIYGEDVEKWLEKLGKNDDNEDNAIDEEDESE